MEIKNVGGWYFPGNDIHLAEAIQKDGSYQKRHRQSALAFVKNRECAVDIGSHVGLWSVDLAKSFNRVIAFEPEPTHIECYRLNVLDKYSNVLLHQYALGECKGTIFMYNPNPITSGNMKVTTNPTDTKVEIKRLDDFKIAEKIDFIKIDTEGYEYKVLLGGKETIITNKPVIVIEQKPGSQEYGIGRYDACRLLESWGAKKLSQCVDDYIYGW